MLNALLRAGYVRSHVRGSHHYLRSQDGQHFVVIPIHGNRDLPAGTMRSILRQADLSAEELADLLRG